MADPAEVAAALAQQWADSNRQYAFLERALEKNDKALFASIEDEGPYRSPCWTLASVLKGHPHFSQMGSWEVVQYLDQALEAFGGWEARADYDTFDNEIDPRSSFIECWEIIEAPLHLDPEPKEALPFARRWPLNSDRWPTERDATYRALVGLCYWYAKLLGRDGWFFLSCRLAGELIGVSHTQAAEHLRRATREGLLALTSLGTRRTGRASEYVFQIDSVLLCEAD